MTRARSTPAALEGASAAPSAEEIVGGRYRVLRLLGKGGMGAVYEAEHTWTRARVALKVMRADLAMDDAYARRFMQEAQTAASLKHPSIVRVLDMGQDADTGELFLVQELLIGHDLGHHLKCGGRLPTRQALDLIVPVMEGLVAAHARGVVHRDLKPDNIFLAQTSHGVVPTLIDFGIAKVIGDNGVSPQETGTGPIIGTPYYLSPEQASGDSSLDARSDVWSLGVVLYQMLSGERPYAAPNASMALVAIVHDLPRPLADAAPDLPRELGAIVMRALVQNRDARYPTMQAFLVAVRAYITGAGTSLPPAYVSASSSVPTPTPEFPRATPSPSTPIPAPGTSEERFPPPGPPERTRVPGIETVAPIEKFVRGDGLRQSGLVVGGAVGALALAAMLMMSRATSPVRAARPAASVPSPAPAPVAHLVVDQGPAARPASTAVVPTHASDVMPHTATPSQEHADDDSYRRRRAWGGAVRPNTATGHGVARLKAVAPRTAPGTNASTTPQSPALGPPPARSSATSMSIPIPPP